MEIKPIFTEHGIIEVEPPSPFCVLKEKEKEKSKDKEKEKEKSKEKSNILPVEEDEDGYTRLRHNDYDISCFNKKTKKRQYLRRLRRKIRNQFRKKFD